MSQQVINVGVTADSGTGDTMRAGMQKVNANFTEVYSDVADAQADATAAGLAAAAAQSTADTALNNADTAQDAAEAAQATADLKLSKGGDTMSGTLNMGGQLISNLATPVSGTDAVTMTYADSKLSKAGGTMTGALDMGSHLINNVTTPVSPADAATKGYVDGLVTPVAAELARPDGFCFETFDDYSLGAISVLDKGLGWSDNGICTGATIVSKNRAGNGTSAAENRLSLDAGEYIRKLPWGDGWNRMQLFVQFRVASVAAIFTGDGYFGICSGQSNTSSSITCANFIGIAFNKGVNGWSFTTGTRADFTGYSSGQTFINRRGNTNSNWGGTSGSDGRSYSASEGYTSTIHIDFFRPVFANDAASTNYDGTVRSTNGTFVQYSHSKSDILTLMTTEPPATLGSAGAVLMGSGAEIAPSFATDQSTGKFDTLNLYWPVSGKQFEISAIGVRKVY